MGERGQGCSCGINSSRCQIRVNPVPITPADAMQPRACICCGSLTASPLLHPVPSPRMSFDGPLLATVMVSATATAMKYHTIPTATYHAIPTDRQTNGVRGTPKSRGRSNSSSRSRGRRGKSRSGSKPKVGVRVRGYVTQGGWGSQGTSDVHPRVSYVDANVAAGIYGIPLLAAGDIVNSSRSFNTANEECLSFGCSGEGGDLSRVLQLKTGVCAAHSLWYEPPIYTYASDISRYTHAHFGDKILGIRLGLCSCGGTRLRLCSVKTETHLPLFDASPWFPWSFHLGSYRYTLYCFHAPFVPSGCLTQAPQPVSSEHDPRLEPHSQRQGGPPQGNRPLFSLILFRFVCFVLFQNR